MRKLILLSIWLLSFSSFAEVDSTVNQNTYTIGIEGGSEVTQLLREMAGELNTTTEYLWEVTVKQGSVNAYKNIVYMSFLISILWGFWFVLRANYRDIRYKQCNNKKDQWERWDDWMAAVYVIGGIISVASLIIVGVCSSAIIDGFINPEYWALDTILDKIN